MAVGRIPADPRAGCRQHPQLGARELARADQENRAGLQIEKHRQKSHALLAFPNWG